MEFLKETLGEELYGQFAEKMKDSKIKLADLSGGAYIGKEKYDTLKTAHDGLAGQLAEANAAIDGFKGMDIDGIKAAAEEWKAKAEESERNAAARISEMEYDAALKDALSGVKFSSDYARQGVFGEIKGKKLPLENGTIMGLQDVLKTIREAQPTAFAPDKPPATVVPGITGNTPLTSDKPTKEMSYEERYKLKHGTT